VFSCARCVQECEISSLLAALPYQWSDKKSSGYWQVRASSYVSNKLLPPRSSGKTRGCYCSCWAPDDGREDARNMLSCTYK